MKRFLEKTIIIMLIIFTCFNAIFPPIIYADVAEKKVKEYVDKYIKIIDKKFYDSYDAVLENEYAGDLKKLAEDAKKDILVIINGEGGPADVITQLRDDIDGNLLGNLDEDLYNEMQETRNKTTSKRECCKLYKLCI